ncbi:hypothetical protein CMI47_15275 [Candidatus Pacearchaeota archaeon]|nr:hypothetical protein [Candidatus Pacearchaeota archaeon]|tara:strand:- start:1157 stop:1777 length:621 start_codon:yes stop_codon:yes gene_type:complete
MYDTAIILAHELNPDKSLSDQTRERVDLGISLFNKGQVRTLIMSGGHGNRGANYGVTLADKMEEYALKKDVPGDKILKEPISIETVAQLIFCKQAIMAPRNWKSALIISHDYHINPRVTAISNLIFGQEYIIDFASVPSDLSNDPAVQEKERQSLTAFQETFSGITPGSDSEALEALLSNHKLYNTDSPHFLAELEKLKQQNTQNG